MIGTQSQYVAFNCCNYVLRVMASDEVEDDIDARQGSMLHEVVKQFEAELGGSPPSPALTLSASWR